jgi:hypothetical protein
VRDGKAVIGQKRTERTATHLGQRTFGPIGKARQSESRTCPGNESVSGCQRYGDWTVLDPVVRVEDERNEGNDVERSETGMDPFVAPDVDLFNHRIGETTDKAFYT